MVNSKYLRATTLQPREFWDRDYFAVIPEEEAYVPDGLRDHQIWRDCPREFIGYVLLLWMLLTEEYDPALSAQACQPREKFIAERRIRKMHENLCKPHHEKRYIYKVGDVSRKKPWKAYFRWNKSGTIGYYGTQEEAATAWDEFVTEWLRQNECRVMSKFSLKGVMSC